MIRPIMKIEFLLARPCIPMHEPDPALVQDLLDTLEAHADTCVGLAANMIGVPRCAVAFSDFGTADDFDASLAYTNRVMFNPRLVKYEEPYSTSEGCLSLKGMRNTMRFRKIVVRYQDTEMVEHEEAFEGFTAQIVQHMIDHCLSKVI